jgi:hypothetical protein
MSNRAFDKKAATFFERNLKALLGKGKIQNHLSGFSPAIPEGFPIPPLHIPKKFPTFPPENVL